MATNVNEMLEAANTAVRNSAQIVRKRRKARRVWCTPSGVRSLLRHRVILQKMMPAGPHQECDNVVDHMLRSNAE
jgi:hypothetical protein